MKKNTRALLITFFFFSFGLITPAFALPDLKLFDLIVDTEPTTVRGSTVSIRAVIQNNASTENPVPLAAQSYEEGTSEMFADAMIKSAQSFQVNDVMELQTISLFCYNTGGAGHEGDLLTVELRSDNGGIPGTVLQSASANGSNTSHWQDFTFNHTLNPGTLYWIVAYNNEDLGEGWTWLYDKTNGYSNGSYSTYFDKGPWSVDIGRDFQFRIIGKHLSIKFYDTWNGITNQIGNTEMLSYTLAGGGTFISTVTWAATPGDTHIIQAIVGYAGNEEWTGNNQLTENFKVSTAPPANIINLTALTHSSTEGAVTLKWTAPGEDENRGKVSEYVLKYSSAGPITSTNFDTTATYNYAWVPANFKMAGNEESITIDNLIRGATYWFALKAKDGDTNGAYGHWSVWQSSTEVPTINIKSFAEAYDAVPAAPSNLSATGGDRQVSLDWDAPVPWPDDFLFYRVYCDSITHDGTNMFVLTETAADTGFLHTGLEHFNTYYYRVTAVDLGPKLVESSYSNAVSTGLIPPYAPGAFHGVTLSTTNIRWEWSDRSGNEAGFRIRDDSAVLSTAAVNATNWTETGLTPNSPHTRYIQAFNVFGSSPTDWVDISVTTYTYANPPSGRTVLSITNNSVELGWSNNNNPGNTDYGIVYSTDNFITSTATARAFADHHTTLSYTVPGLAPYTTYYFKITAFNGYGAQTAYEVIIVTRTHPNSPNDPSGFYGTALSTTSIVWNWVDNSSGSCTEFDYKIRDYPGGAIIATLPADTTHWLEVNLSTNTQYMRYVQAYNPTGTAASNFDPTYTLAFHVKGSTVTAVTYNTVNLSWLPNNNPGWTSFGIIYSTDNFTTSTHTFRNFSNPTTALSDTVTGLEPLTTYYFKVNAYNGDGISTLYDIAVSTRTNPGIPPAPGSFDGVALSTGSILWSWLDNSGGQYAEDGFRILNATGGIVKELDAGTTSWLESNLGLNTSYYRYVQAYNISGSNVSNSRIKYTLTYPPTGSYVISVTYNSVRLGWAANTNPPVHTYFGIIRSEDNFAASTITVRSFADQLNSLTYTVPGLQPLTTYYFKINTFNGDGIPSAYDIAVSTMTNPGPPAPPTQFYGVALSPSSIDWNWTDNSTGASGEDGFRLRDGAGSLITAIAKDATHWIEAAPPLGTNTAYTRYIEAYNSIGISSSNVDTTYTLANPPVNSRIASRGANTVGLGWETNNNPPHTVWGIISSTNDFTVSTITVLDFSDAYTPLSYLHEGLEPETTYWYRVLAYNGDGIPTLYDTKISTMTLPALPDAPTNFRGTALSTGSIRWSWISNAPEAQGIRIMNSTGGIVADQLSPNATYWLEDNLSVNASYYRYAEAYNETGGNPSNTDITYTLAYPPVETYVIATTSVTVKLGWSSNNNPPHTRWLVARSSDMFMSDITQCTYYDDDLTATSYLNTSLRPSTTYWYVLYAFNGDGILSDNDVVVSTRTNAVFPARPSNFIGVALSTDSICWSWKDNSPYEEGFRIKTATGYIINELPPDATFWIEAGLSVNTSYYRYAESYSLAGSSASNADVRFTLANPPWDATIASSTYHSVYVHWNTDSASRLKVTYSTMTLGSSPADIVKSKLWEDNVSVTPYRLKGLYLNSTYYFYLWSYNGDGILNISSFTALSAYTPDLPASIFKMDPAAGGTQTALRLLFGTTVQISVSVPAGTVDRYTYIPINTNALADPQLITIGNILNANNRISLDRMILLTETITEIDMYDFWGSSVSGFNHDVTIKFTYPDSDSNNLLDDPVTNTRYRERVLAMVYLDPAAERWRQVSGYYVDTVLNEITVNSPHLSLYAIASLGPEEGKTAKVYPNPFKPNSGLGHTVVNFTNIERGSTLKVYTMAGVLVWEHEMDDDKVEWNAKNAHGKDVASGVYIYLATDDQGSKRMGNFAIIR